MLVVNKKFYGCGLTFNHKNHKNIAPQKPYSSTGGGWTSTCVAEHSSVWENSGMQLFFQQGLTRSR